MERREGVRRKFTRRGKGGFWKIFVIDFMQNAIKIYIFSLKITMEIFHFLVYYIAVREE